LFYGRENSRPISISQMYVCRTQCPAARCIDQSTPTYKTTRVASSMFVIITWQSLVVSISQVLAVALYCPAARCIDQSTPTYKTTRVARSMFVIITWQSLAVSSITRQGHRTSRKACPVRAARWEAWASFMCPSDIYPCVWTHVRMHFKVQYCRCLTRVRQFMLHVVGQNTLSFPRHYFTIVGQKHTKLLPSLSYCSAVLWW
jgi:hypothetical protein